jgi:hypothetical protein
MQSLLTEQEITKFKSLARGKIMFDPVNAVTDIFFARGREAYLAACAAVLSAFLVRFPRHKDMRILIRVWAGTTLSVVESPRADDCFACEDSEVLHPVLEGKEVPALEARG